jgi:hypothetical protein
MGRGTGGGTGSVSVASLSDADRTAIGDEAAQRALVYTVTGGSGAGDFDEINQRMEGVKRTSGKTVTVSFWAKATSGAPTIGLNWQQSFGTGGSPSTVVVGTAQTVTLSTTWTRYSKTFAITSVSGKTFGTTPQTDFLEFNFWLSSGASFNTEAGGIGVQTGIFSFWAMQLEIAPSASSFEKLDYALQTIECLRFFQVIQIIFNGNVPAGTSVAVSNSLLTAMRVTPTLVLINVTNTNLSGVSGGSTISSVYITATAVATTGFSINTTITASSDL